MASPRKQPSGAAKDRARRLRDEEARRHEAQRRQALPNGERPDLDAYLELGPPPRDPASTVAWANSACAALLWETLTDPIIDARERRRVGADLVAKIGLTYPRAHIEAKIKAVSDRLFLHTARSPDAETGKRPKSLSRAVTTGRWSPEREAASTYAAPSPEEITAAGPAPEGGWATEEELDETHAAGMEPLDGRRVPPWSKYFDQWHGNDAGGWNRFDPKPKGDK